MQLYFCMDVDLQIHLLILQMYLQMGPSENRVHLTLVDYDHVPH